MTEWDFETTMAGSRGGLHEEGGKPNGPADNWGYHMPHGI